MKRLSIFFAFLVFLISCTGRNETGRPLSEWKEGFLDIHYINTGRGESIYHIFPDGTSMLVDAAGSLLKQHKNMPTEPKPSADISSAKVIADYIHFFMPEKSEGMMDYYMVSHFHGDHIGNYVDSLPMHSSGKFRLMSFAEIGALVPFKNAVLRYVDPKMPTFDNTPSAIETVYAMIDWAKEEYGTSTITFTAGRDDQIVLTHDPEKYDDFTVMNIASGGHYWTGNGTETATDIPDYDYIMANGGREAFPPENVMSCVFRLSYGDFDYFSGGDIQYRRRSKYPYFDIEAPLAEVLDEVEVMKASHHGTSDCNGKPILEALSPDVVVINPWRDIQPNPKTLKRIYDENPDCAVFSTNMHESNKPVIAEYLPRIKAYQGHIVVRVSPGGKDYKVYVLEDGDQSYKVNSVFGPYECK